jgi:hypothetical protein
MFKDIYILLFGKRLNMAIAECFQLNAEDLEEGELVKVYEKIIRKIASGKIKSPHISQSEAQQMVYLMDHLYNGGADDHFKDSDQEFKG